MTARKQVQPCLWGKAAVLFLAMGVMIGAVQIWQDGRRWRELTMEQAITMLTDQHFSGVATLRICDLALVGVDALNDAAELEGPDGVAARRCLAQIMEKIHPQPKERR